MSPVSVSSPSVSPAKQHGGECEVMARLRCEKQWATKEQAVHAQAQAEQRYTDVRIDRQTDRQTNKHARYCTENEELMKVA